MTHAVDFYFDFLSPYACLALLQAREFGQAHGIEWRVRPVVYGVLLTENGLVGPAESAAKRLHTFRDVARLAHLAGLPWTLPPAHPFRSLEALRTVCLYADRAEGFPLAVRLAEFCWQEGRDLTDLAVLAEGLRSLGLETEGLADRLNDPATKSRLRESTSELLQRGGFGVPSFYVQGELFWGQDRLDHLARFLRGELSLPMDLEALRSLPRGVDRKLASPR